MPKTATVFSSITKKTKKKSLVEPKTIVDGDIRIEIPKTIVKRDGRTVNFEISKIEKAIKLCFEDIDRTPSTGVSELTKRVVNIIGAKYSNPTVEQVQDTVELVLQAAGEFAAAKHYILYRAEHAKLREARPIPEAVVKAFSESDNYFENQIQKFQFFDKYSRFNYDLSRRETWKETVDRSVDFLHEISNGALPASDYERVRAAVLAMKATPSMRLLAMAGAAARRNNLCIYNCSYQPVESIDSFVEALLISMNGCGVGFSVESKYVENLPRVKRQTGAMADPWLVEDTTEGWGEAVRLGLSTWFDGGDIKFDYSALRPAGAILRVKGGRSSGPEPFKRMLEFARARILSRQGSFLRPIDAHDIMCEVGSAAVSGGMRRTAMISLFDFDDMEMRFCKSGDFERENSQRWNANNSAVWPASGLTQLDLMKQMMDMVGSGRGEPGIFNREGAINMRPARRGMGEFGTNPSLRKGTLVYTTKGIFPIEQLQGKTFEVRNLNSKLSRAECFLSGKNKPLYEVVLSNGQSYFATKEHRWAVKDRYNTIRKVVTTELKSGMFLPVIRNKSLEFGTKGTCNDGFLAGWLTGDGWMTTRGDNKHTQIGLILGESDLHLKKRLEDQLRKIGCQSTFQRRERGRSVWYEINTQSTSLVKWCEKFDVGGKKVGIPACVWKTASEDFRKGFVDGLFSSDGSVVDGGIVFTSAHKKLTEEVQSLLGFYGINGVIKSTRASSNFPNGKDYHKVYSRYDLRIRSKTNVVHFGEVFSLSHKEKGEKLRRFKTNKLRGLLRVKEVKRTDLREDVWDIRVYDETHCFQLAYSITGNCGEIILRPWELCNLSIAIARKEDTYETLKNKVEVAAIIGTIQSMATNFPGLRPMWKENCEEERLLGVDINGQLDSPAAQDPSIQNRLRQVAIETNRNYAAKLSINQSAAVTCVKPSGNSSQLFNCSSGIHPRWAPYYVRNIRVSAHSPVYQVLKDEGVPMDPENGQTAQTANTFVVHFPVKSPDGAVTRKNLTAIAQCEYWLQNKVHWTEHNPSVTVTYHPDEVVDVIKWVWEHKGLIGGMSFLPAFDAAYAQMPYQEIEKEEYEKLMQAFPEIDFSKLYRYEEEDYTKAAQELACVAGACDIDYSEGKIAS